MNKGKLHLVNLLSSRTKIKENRPKGTISKVLTLGQKLLLQKGLKCFNAMRKSFNKMEKGFLPHNRILTIIYVKYFSYLII